MNFWGLNEPQFRRRLVALLMVIVATALTCHLMVSIAAGEWLTFMGWGSCLGLLVWTFFAREAWWILMPAAIGFGGLFYFGFRLYLHEIMLVVVFLPLLPQMATGRKSAIHRKPFPTVGYVLLGYMILHLLVSWYLAKLDGTAIGSIVRVYGKGLWPLIFGIPFYALGSTRHLKWALWLFFLAAMARSILGVVGYFFPQMVTPVMGFILPGLYSEGLELRESGLWLIYLSLTLFSLSPYWLIKAWYLLLIFLAAWCVTLGGARVSLAMAGGIPLVWAFFQKRYVVLVTGVIGLALLLTLFNVNPELVYQFPKRFQRTFSILVFKSPYQNVHAIVEGSNEWHYELMQRGYRKWVDTPLTLLFGNRVIASHDMSDFSRLTYYERIQVAENMAAYESGLWTVLAMLGLVGFGLYAGLFGYLLGPIVRSLWRDKIRDYPQAFAFLAVASILVWVIFSWVAGHFPSEPLMLAVIARAAHDDQKYQDDLVRETTTGL